MDIFERNSANLKCLHDAIRSLNNIKFYCLGAFGGSNERAFMDVADNVLKVMQSLEAIADNKILIKDDENAIG